MHQCDQHANVEQQTLSAPHLPSVPRNLRRRPRLVATAKQRAIQTPPRRRPPRYQPTSMSTTPILITGATGKQGGAVINALIASKTPGLTVYAVTRKAVSPAAQALVAKSSQRLKIHLVQGDMSNCAAIFRAVPAKIKYVFGVTPIDMSIGANPRSEEVQGKALVDAAIAHGVQHFVYTSVDRHGPDSDSSDTNVPHFISKARVEQHLKEKSGSAMTWTILRPVAFMDNFAPGLTGKMFPTMWSVSLAPTTKLQLIATADIGHFAAQALLSPAKFAGRAISLAGDELTFSEASEVWQSRLEREIPATFGFVGSALLWALKDMGSMFRWFEETGYAADIPAVRREHPQLLTFGDWLKTSGL